jgi:hypothetical protein
VAFCGDNDMNVIRPAIDCVQVPLANCAMLLDRRFDDAALPLIERNGAFRHVHKGHSLPFNIWRAENSCLLDPTAIITG